MLREYLPFWARLTEGQQRRLEEGAAVRRFARGEMVYGGGAEGVRLLTEKLKAELSDAMAMCGVHSLSQITHALVF